MSDTSNYMPTGDLTSHIMNLLGASQPQAPGLAQQILSGRFNQPDMGDVGQSAYLTTQSALNPNVYRPMSPEQVRGQNEQALLDPYTKMLQAQQLELGNQFIAPLAQSKLTGEYIQNNVANQTALPLAQQDLQQKMLANQVAQATAMPMAQANLSSAQTAAQFAPQMAQSEIGLRGAQSGLAGAQAGYYGSALERDLAEKQFDYQNNPANMQAMMMANYMRSLAGNSAPQSPTSQSVSVPAVGGMTPIPNSGIPQVPAQQLNPGQPLPPSGPIPMPPAPQGNIPQQMQQNAQPQGSGFNPMSAMLAKQLGLTDMQIGPNGQPMPIPGSMKIENGSVISFDANGKPQSNIPVNPRAQGLFEQKLQDIKANLDKLHAIGGTVEEGGASNFLENKGTQLAASQDGLWGLIPGGQTLLQGTPAQTLRDNIQADVKQALPLYMQAFGITPGMERAQAAQQMLQEAIGGSLTKSRQHTLSNLSNLSQTAGTGELAKQIDTQSNPASPQDIVNELRSRGVVQ